MAQFPVPGGGPPLPDFTVDDPKQAAAIIKVGRRARHAVTRQVAQLESSGTFFDTVREDSEASDREKAVAAKDYLVAVHQADQAFSAAMSEALLGAIEEITDGAVSAVALRRRMEAESHRSAGISPAEDSDIGREVERRMAEADVLGIDNPMLAVTVESRTRPSDGMQEFHVMDGDGDEVIEPFHRLPTGEFVDGPAPEDEPLGSAEIDGINIDNVMEPERTLDFGDEGVA